MPMFLRFFEQQSDGKVVEALGSDSIFFRVENVPFHRLHKQALDHARSLRPIGKNYVGYYFLQGRSLLESYPSTLRETYFTKEELS